MTDVEAKGLTILHLSDFHFKPNFQYDQDIILNELLKKISEMNKSEWQPDLILCTGDIAYSGKPGEYKSARDFLDQLLKITGLTKEKLFTVPGNHDVDWDEPSPFQKSNSKKMKILTTSSNHQTYSKASSRNFTDITNFPATT